jgi:hypothetical protein
MSSDSYHVRLKERLFFLTVHWGNMGITSSKMSSSSSIEGNEGTKGNEGTPVAPPVRKRR